MALAGRGAACITGTPILIEMGALYDNVETKCADVLKEVQMD